MDILELKIDEELTLRQYSLSDSVAIFDLISRNREHLSQNGDITSQKYGTWIDVMNSIQNNPLPERLRFGLWYKDTLIGTRNITPESNRTAETGSYLGKEFQGKGYMGRALNRMVQFAFDDLELIEIYSLIASTNTRSINMVLKAGFVLEEKKSIYTTDTPYAKLYFSKINPKN